MRDRSLLSWAAVTAAMLVVPSAGSAGPWVPLPGEFATDVTGQHFSAAHYFDDDGNDFGYPFDLVMDGREIRVVNELGWKRRVSFLLAVPVTSVTSRSSLAPLAGSRTGLSDLGVGAHYRILDGSSAVAVQADWTIPMGYERDVFPSLGDGLHHFSGQLDAGTSIRAIQGFVEGSVGYLSRVDIHLNPMKATRHFGSDILFYQADVAFWAGPSVLLAGRYVGLSSSAKNASDLDHSLQAAGPEVRYRVDDRMDVFVGGRFTFSGRNVDRTNAYYLGLALKQTRLDRLQGFLGGTRRP